MIYLTVGFESSLNLFIRKNLTTGMVALDFGANIGAHTLAMGAAVKRGGQTHPVEATQYAVESETAGRTALPLWFGCFWPSCRASASQLRHSRHQGNFIPGSNGRDDRIRTCDLLVPNEARYQAALHPEKLSGEKDFAFYVLSSICSRRHKNRLHS